MHKYKLTFASGNTKTGRIPVSTSSKSTCPTRCRLMNNGCFAESGPLSWHWNKLPSKGLDLDEFCSEVRKIPKRGLWRHNQAGDLPGDKSEIDAVSLHKIVSANRGRSGFTYTHYDPRVPTNARAIHYANTQGFTVNMSAETLDEADEYLALNIGPVVVILPTDQTESLKTPMGHTVTVCPASLPDSTMTCAQCAVCAVPDRKGVIGFPTHGSGKAKAQAMFFQPLA